jgi:two-component system, OmpR family, sensor histidine kinase ChvG
VRLPRPRLGIRLKLLLVSSLLLLIPWLGLQYVRELERLLLQTQEQGLVSTARAVATALNDRPSVLLSGEVYSVPLSAGRDLRVTNLTAPITVDGQSADWSQPGVLTHSYAAPADAAVPFAFHYRIGRFGAGVYALFEVNDDHVVMRDPERPELAANDHLQLAVVTADDEFLHFAIDAQGDGPVSAWLVPDTGPRVPDNRISGVWRATSEGYLVELRLPRSLIGPRLSFAVVDVDDPETRTLVSQIGTGGTASRDELGTVLVPSPEISDLIRGLGRSRSRIWVVDVNRRVLAHAGSLHQPAAPPREEVSLIERLAGAVLRPITRRFVAVPRDDFEDVEPGTYRLEGRAVESALRGQETTRWRLTRDSRAVVLSAAHPVFVDTQVRGAVLVEETTNDVLAVRNRAFEKLFAAILLVCLMGALALFVFATRLSWRIKRLRDQVEHAIDPHGRVQAAVFGPGSRDEIGDLTRSFAGILDRQRQYTGYLEQVGNRLSHEMRTPVGVVRSSLDNLRAQSLPDSAGVYIDRADEGLRRLANVLSRMSEATRLEGALAATEREHFDLGHVVRGCVDGYRLTNPGREIVLEAPSEPIPLWGAPDLLAQLLDKLVHNALGFAHPGTAVQVALGRTVGGVTLAVRNEGPLLPAGMQGRLFESMVSIREGAADGGPHLGLGLYIVRLVAEFHDGRAEARNRDDVQGVEVVVTLPTARHDEARLSAAEAWEARKGSGLEL